MFLYENNGQFIDVYKLKPKLEELKKYRKKEMGKIPKAERVWFAKTNDSDLKILERVDIPVSFNELNVRGKRYDFAYFHCFNFSSDEDKNKQFLEWYYEDEECIYNLCKIYKDSRYMYILRLQNDYAFYRYGIDSYVMKGIINIPESLYLLEALLQGRFNLIGDKDVTEQLKLFDVQHYGRINTDVLKNICDYEILLEPYESIIDRTKKNYNVVSRVKKLAR